VNPEHFESLAGHVWAQIRSLGPIFVLGLKSYDGFLRRTAGEGNTIVLWFLRVLSAGFTLVAISALLYIAFRFAAG
jgi:hypothetical protein